MDQQQLLQRKALLERKRELLIKKQQLQSQSFSQPQETSGPSYPGENLVKSAVGPIYEPAKELAKGYGAVREGFSEGISSVLPDGGPSFPMSAPNPMFPASQIPFGRKTGRESLKELAGIGFDELATLGVAKAPRMAGRAVKTADKGITSILRRIGGKTAGDIKNTRSLAREFGPEYVFSKTKSKPEYVGREIAPKATDIASSRVRSMEPEALREIGVSPEATDIAQNVKGRFGLQEFPTKSQADEFFENVINSAPEEARIQPNNILKAIDDLEAQGVNLREFKQIKQSLIGQPSTEQAVFSGASKQARQLNPQEYKNLRAFINDLTEGGNNPFFQKVKTALDMDAEAVIPQLSEAKGVFQVSRELPKAEGYLNKTSLGKEMQGKLEGASAPKNVEQRLGLKRILGDEAEPLLKDLEAQRLAKEWYGGIGEGPGVSGRPMLDVIKGILRPAPRAYERGRANLIQMFRGKPKSVQATKTVSPSTPRAIQQPIVKKDTPIDYEAIKKNVSQYDVPQGPPVGREAQLIAEDEAVRRAVASGYIGEGGQASSFRGPDIMEQPIPFDPLQYKGGAGKFSGPDVIQQPSSTDPLGLGYGGSGRGKYSGPYEYKPNAPKPPVKSENKLLKDLLNQKLGKMKKKK